ncbi:MAG TPA: hypothetical protein VG228_03140 [Solirubrobacteraceae bacterium]|jgi:hypothetical protein|nr:hypothetical protein [Solirubrobacteraceae bacterium]
MTTSDLSRQPVGAGVAAGGALCRSLEVCEAIALEAIADPSLRSGAVLQARRLRARAEEALEISAHTYGRARQQLELTAGAGAHGAAHETGRDATLRRALIDAADGLIALAAAAADAAALAAALTEAVEPSRRPDAAGMAELSLGVARCLDHLVQANLALKRVDERRDRVAGLVMAAEQAAVAARAAVVED